jgi:Uncharacterised nucleotidyltransferase
MQYTRKKTAMNWSSRADKRVVEAVVGILRDSTEDSVRRLSGLTHRNWVSSYYWLDASGTALYFLDRLKTLGIEDAIPTATLERLEQNLADNRRRSAAMFAEFCSLNHAFQAAGVQYANEKGFSLTPESCTDQSLRCALDLDFLVDGRDLKLCREILEKRGYVLSLTASTEWKFEAGSSELARIEDLYKPKPQRSVELHFTFSDDDARVPTRDERLDRLVPRAWNGHLFPVLSPADQFIEQSLHLLRHLRSPATRPSWLLEYKRHMSARCDEWQFWDEVRRRSQTFPNASLAIGLATLLSSQLFGGRAPAQLNEWTLDKLSSPVRLWADRYGRRAVLADGPGTKLHKLLEGEIVRDDRSLRKKRPSLLQFYRGTQVCHAAPNDGLAKRLRQRYYRARFILFRVRFHLVEELRYCIENVRWKHLLSNLIPSTQGGTVPPETGLHRS